MKLIRRDKGSRGVERRGKGDLSPWGGRGGPFPDLNRIRREIDRLFERPFDLLTGGTSFFEGWEPTVDIYEDNDKITVKAEVPGMKKEDLDVSIHGNTLILSGERKSEEEQENRERYRAERFFGRFQRSVTLPQTVDSNRIEARYNDGVLTITLPKAEEKKPKQIEVKTT